MTDINKQHSRHLLDILQFHPSLVFATSKISATSITSFGAMLKRQATENGLCERGFMEPSELMDLLGITVKTVATVYPMAIGDDGHVWLMMGTEDKGPDQNIPTRIFPTGMWEPNRQQEVEGAALQAVGETLPMAAIREFEEEGAYKGAEEKLQHWGVSLSYVEKYQTIYVIHHYAYMMSVEEMDKAKADMAERWNRPEEERNPEERFETYDLERFNLASLDIPAMQSLLGHDAQIGGLPIAHRQDRLFWKAIQANQPKLAQAMLSISKSE